MWYYVEILLTFQKLYDRSFQIHQPSKFFAGAIISKIALEAHFLQEQQHDDGSIIGFLLLRLFWPLISAKGLVVALGHIGKYWPFLGSLQNPDLIQSF